MAQRQATVGAARAAGPGTGTPGGDRPAPPRPLRPVADRPQALAKTRNAGTLPALAEPPSRERESGEGEVAPQVGLEPTTLRLTAECSTIELLRNVLERAAAEGGPRAERGV